MIAEQKNKHIFYVKNRGCDAKGFYDENGFTILKGSILSNDDVPSLAWKEKRRKLIKELAIVQDNKTILEVDYTFSSPSTAADFCIGRGVNGWVTWKDKDGQTLNEVYRKALE